MSAASAGADIKVLQEGSRRRDREWDREGARDFDRARYIPARPQAPLHHNDQLHSPRPPRYLACCVPCLAIDLSAMLAERHCRRARPII